MSKYLYVSPAVIEFIPVTTIMPKKSEIKVGRNIILKLEEI